MKKLILTASALVLGLSLAAPAMADCNGIYLAGRGGIFKNHFKKKQTGGFDTTELDKQQFMMSGALGYRYDYWRTEMEYVWRQKNEYHDQEMGFTHRFKTHSLMWNNYIDFAPYSWFTPYAGVGLGYTNIKYKSSDDIDQVTMMDKDKNNFTWSLGGGISVKVTNRINVDVGYRYYDIGSFENEDVTLQEVYGGLRYVF